MFFFGNPSLKELQKMMDHPEKYDQSYLLSLYVHSIIERAGFEGKNEQNLITMLMFDKRNRAIAPKVVNYQPLTISEETARCISPKMTVNGLELLVKAIKEKGLKIDL